jgi:multidrug resistance efflux pump
MRTSRGLLTALLLLELAGCNRPLPPSTQAAAPPPAASSQDPGKHEIRITGLIQAVRSVKVLVPQIQGQYANMTLTHLIPNGTRVQPGDVIATFDPTTQMDAARDAQAKFEDLGHQVDQKIAENRASAEKRMVDLREAEGELTKAELELKKGPVLGDIDKAQSNAKAEGARSQAASLKKSMAFREQAEVAALRVLELQRDRQKIAMQRAQDNLQKLEIKASLAGMVVHELTFRGGSLGKAQEGDQIYRGYPLASIFDPSEMLVRCVINEPDVAALSPGIHAPVYLDAFPELELRAHFISASPIASSPLGTPIKSFVAIFGIDKPDPHLLPDLSAAVVLTMPEASGSSPGAKK